MTSNALVRRTMLIDGVQEAHVLVLLLSSMFSLFAISMSVVVRQIVQILSLLSSCMGNTFLLS